MTCGLSMSRRVLLEGLLELTAAALDPITGRF
jgi:hypothetical protein